MMGGDETLPALFAARVDASGDAVALQEFDSDRQALVEAITWNDWRARTYDMAAAFVASGCARGSACAILAGNSSLWPLAELGAIHAGLVTVGVYPSAAASQLRTLLADAAVSAVVVDSELQLTKVREATIGWSEPLLVVVRAAGAELRCEAESLVYEVDWTAFVARGAAVRREDPAFFQLVQQGWTLLVPDDIAMLVYTSGSTGVPKGARLSHRYVVASARSVQDTLGLTRDDSSLSYLPFAHASERIFGLYTRIACGMTATLVEDPAQLWAASVVAEPTLFGGMPRFFEKVYEGLLAARGGESAAAAAEWDRTLARGRERSRLRQVGAPVPPAIDARWQEGRGRIEAVLGGFFGPRLRLATSGGAALPLEVAEYLDACGVTILGAYGQTEHLCGTFNRPECYRHDSVGLAMPGAMLRIADDGEVQFWRSALAFSGYHERPAETRDAFTDDGLWLRTGDLGTVDQDGFLRITGRTKELIALSNGKKVAPLPLEARLAEGGLIAHAMIHGEGRPYLVALISLRWRLVERWQRTLGIEGDAATLSRHAALREEVSRIVARVNAEVSRPEQVRKFMILPHEFSVEAGEITPSHKVRRSVVAARYADELETLYQETT
ncbi:MAG: AMP-binding protein [Gemmatimonadota bacterium]